jgi:hypothetical protein
MNKYLKSILIQLKNDELKNFNFMIKDNSSELFEKKRHEFKTKRKARFNIQVIILLLSLWNYLYLSFEKKL